MARKAYSQMKPYPTLPTAGLLAEISSCQSQGSGGATSNTDSAGVPSGASTTHQAIVQDGAGAGTAERVSVAPTTAVGGSAPLPVWGAALVAPATTQPQLKVYELTKQRIHDTTRPMSPIGAMPADELASPDAWLDADAPAGAVEDADCEVRAFSVLRVTDACW
ncbi:MAG: hypothetical protein OXU20_22065 [Myxococcales bacterium]|nr:hypothetical protein [Myxococcales bacterium]